MSSIMSNANPIPRDANGRFPKGTSGNLRGRPKGSVTVKQLPTVDMHRLLYLSNEQSGTAVGTLLGIMQDKKAARSDRIQAAKVLLTQAWGKPSLMSKQAMEDFNRWLNNLMLTERKYHSLTAVLDQLDSEPMQSVPPAPPQPRISEEASKCFQHEKQVQPVLNQTLAVAPKLVAKPAQSLPTPQGALVEQPAALKQTQLVADVPAEDALQAFLRKYESSERRNQEIIALEERYTKRNAPSW